MSKLATRNVATICKKLRIRELQWHSQYYCTFIILVWALGTLLYCLAVIQKVSSEGISPHIARSLLRSPTHMIRDNMNSVLQWRWTSPPANTRSPQLLAGAPLYLHMTLALINATVGWDRKHNLTQPARSSVFKKRFFCCATHSEVRLFFATMSMTVKAYLLGKDDCNKEIRRFAVDQDVSTSFEYLQRKVLDVFVGLRTAPFQMYYKGKSIFNIL